ncbi:YkuS family protein [Bacillaceae bacterium S4-13-58]
MARIGVEGSLSDVRNALQEKGYDIVELKQEEDAKNCDCCVITGQDKNVMGMATRSTDASVINADGLTAEQVVQEVESRL